MTDTLATREKLRLDGFGRIDETLAFLVDCLGEALRGLGEDALLPYLPWSGAVPEGEPPAGTQQLYSIGFQLLNMVEERVAASIRRDHERTLGADAIHGLFPSALKEMAALGLGPAEILGVLGDVDVQPVLTAHPTEAKRASVRERHRNLYEELTAYENTKYTDRERRRIRARIVTALETLWRTGEIHLVRPNVSDELRYAIHYLRDVFPPAMHQLDLRLTDAWRDAGLPVSMLRAAGNVPRLSLATWIGGDRDGHPLVTPEVTSRALAALRQAAFELLTREVAEVSRHLTVSRQLTSVPAELDRRIEVLAGELDEASSTDLRARHRDEPWRLLANLVAERLRAQAAGGAGYRSPAELDGDFAMLSETLRAAGCNLIDDEHIRPLRQTLATFGFHLADLDVRQNSAFHDAAIAQLLTAAGVPDGADYAAWPEARRMAFLETELASARPFLHDSVRLGGECEDVLQVYRVLAEHRKTWGNAGLGSLIVSMTREVSDLLGVYLLAREAGLMMQDASGTWCVMEVVPLFETLDDLERSPRVLGAFLDHPVVRRSLSARASSGRSKEQPTEQSQQPSVQPSVQIMLGYSDSNKDCGILAAQWGLHRAQKNLAEEGRARGIELCFFHGRGGTISRGAGPTHWFMASLPHGSMNGEFRMTEQGETIAQKYSNLTNATYNLELLLAGAAITTATHRHTAPAEDPGRAFLPFLAERSQAAYQSLLAADGFIQFYRQATLIDALENSRIGSRPPRRTGKKAHSLSDLRAVPWVFSWTQARFYLPGWYGVGSALDALRSESPTEFAALREVLPRSTLLTYVFTNVEANLASANVELMQRYASLVEDAALRERFMQRIVAEFHRTRDLLESLYESPMSSRRPRMQKTLAIREAPLRVLHEQQIARLGAWRRLVADGREADAEAMLPDLLLSINAIASGLRTTG